MCCILFNNYVYWRWLTPYGHHWNLINLLQRSDLQGGKHNTTSMMRWRPTPAEIFYIVHSYLSFIVFAGQNCEFSSSVLCRRHSPCDHENKKALATTSMMRWRPTPPTSTTTHWSQIRYIQHSAENEVGYLATFGVNSTTLCRQNYY